MGALSELRSRLENYFAFSQKEVRDLLIATLIIGFIFSFNDWGTTTFDFVIGLKNFLLVSFLVALAFFVHLSVQRILALAIGFKAEFKVWWVGLALSLIIVFITGTLLGVGLPVILPGGVVLAILVRHRLGEFRYGFNYWENGVIAVYGPISNLALAFLFKIALYIFPQSWFLQKALLINIVFAICTALPIPPLDGINMFFASRGWYVFTFFLIIACSLLIYFTGIILTVIGGAIIALAATLIYHLTIEYPIK